MHVMPAVFDRHAARRAASLALVAAVPLVAGCGPPPNRDAPSGTTVVQDGVAYSVQTSRALNPLEAGDREMLGGLVRKKSVERAGTTLLGVFLQAQDGGSLPRRAVDAPQLVNAFGRVFEPLPLPVGDPFAYRGRVLRPGEQIPSPESVAAEGPEAGALLVFRVPSDQYLTDRPYTLRFGTDDRAASVQLDL
jgi:hypothetical protein